MIENIFKVFDPATSFSLSLNWRSLLIIFLIIPTCFWLCPSRWLIIWSIIIKFIFKEFKILIKHSYSNLIIFLRLFTSILINNLIGLFPHIFTSSRHLRFCLSISMSMWLGLIFNRLYNYFNNLCTHLTPHGTPIIIIPFIVIIESIRLIIRPITLRVRLTANIIAGHLLLTLIGSVKPSYFIISILLLGPQTLLIILELSVSIIQAYVFSILITLYRREI